jgi:hypothetical protein
MRGFRLSVGRFQLSVALCACVQTFIVALVPASAAPVRGSVQLPSELRSGRKLRGYWRLENGIVAIAPPANRNETVVVLSGVKGQPVPARTVTVDLNGFQAVPWTVVVGEGSVVEFKNSDRVPHDLSLPQLPSLMSLERLAPGALRRQRFLTAGGYAVRDSEHPHLVISVLVVTSPFYDTVDERGGFRIADVPDGKATLKVWSGGTWVHEQEIEVGPKSDGLQVKVNTTAKPAAE